MTSPITTHVLDTARGRPAEGVAVTLERQDEASGAWRLVGQGATDADGRLKTLASQGGLTRGFYRLTFDVGGYFAARGVAAFYRSVPIQFVVEDPAQHHHVPLLLNPFGYSTYRGS